MKYLRLGSTGLKVSRLCFGTMGFGSKAWRDWVLPEDQARPFVKRVLDLGINFFDTADQYSDGVSEEILGRALKDFVPRQDVVIATKVYNPTGPGPNDRGLSRKHIRKALEASLRRLGTDHIDLYQIHRWDPETPIEETLAALDQAVRDGLVLHVGASSMYAWQLAKALGVSERERLARFVSMQNHYNLVYREEEREMIPLCMDQSLAIMPWSPLARGFLVGNRRREDWGDTVRAKSDPSAQQRYYRDEDFEVVEALKMVAHAKGASPAQVALAWLLHKPGVTCPIVGPTRIEQLEELVAATEVHLTKDDVAQLEAPYRPHPVLGHS